MVKQGQDVVPTNGGLKMGKRFCLKFQQAQSSSVPRYAVAEGVFFVNIVKHLGSTIEKSAGKVTINSFETPTL